MKKKILSLLFILFLNLPLLAQDHIRKTWEGTYRHNQRLGWHYINTDSAGNILPWFRPDIGVSFDYILNCLWEFWDSIPYVFDGTKYYMVHREWPWNKDYPGIWGGKEDHGIGGDQVQMLLDSWSRLYMYTGNKKIVENMVYQADFYIHHSLSPDDHVWPYIPYPWHSEIKPGFRYDGDMIDGLDVAHVDKAGDLGYHLIRLYKITGNKWYLEIAEKIANTLAQHINEGNEDASPLPYKINTRTGEVKWPYTTNWVWTIRMYEDLVDLNFGDIDTYTGSADNLRSWLKDYALKNNKYGPFFEDISSWSDCGINAGRMVEYILLFPDKWGTTWQEDARKALDWMWNNMKNEVWKEYGVIVINEQTAYPYPGNSHTSRYAYLELLYSQMTGDWSRKLNSVRQLIWATYSVDTEGRNEYPGDPATNEIWFTDGYGDYVAHYLNAMAILPQELTSPDKDRMLGSLSVVRDIQYMEGLINYETYDSNSTEVLRLMAKPREIFVNGNMLEESNLPGNNSWVWQPLENGGVLYVVHGNGNKIKILK